MKGLFILFLTVFNFLSLSFAKEIELKCDGVSSTYSTRINKLSTQKESLIFAFDDAENKIKKTPILVAQGCYPDSKMIEHTCECRVSNEILICDSSWKSDDGKGNPLSNNSTFWINRDNGNLHFHGNTESTSSKERWTLSYYGNDFSCTALNLKKI